MTGCAMRFRWATPCLVLALSLSIPRMHKKKLARQLQTGTQSEISEKDTPEKLIVLFQHMNVGTADPNHLGANMDQ